MSDWRKRNCKYLVISPKYPGESYSSSNNYAMSFACKPVSLVNGPVKTGGIQKMKQLLFIAIIFTFISGSYIYIPSIANAETISKEETTTVATRKFAVDKKENVKASDESADITNIEKKLLARLVHAEAKGEPFAGKVAVADVVLNRLDDKQFPDTVESVIYEKNAFQPVQNGSIDKAADKESMEAVEEALNNGKENKELLYFYNPDTATSDWIFTRQVIKHIGNHAFSI